MLDQLTSRVDGRDSELGALPLLRPAILGVLCDRFVDGLRLTPKSSHLFCGVCRFVYRRQQLPDFWGMREFYSTVRAVNKGGTSATGLQPQMVMEAVMRNYGGPFPLCPTFVFPALFWTCRSRFDHRAIIHPCT
jgi:hypothetical protein